MKRKIQLAQSKQINAARAKEGAGRPTGSAPFCSFTGLQQLHCFVNKEFEVSILPYTHGIPTPGFPRCIMKALIRMGFIFHFSDLKCSFCCK